MVLLVGGSPSELMGLGESAQALTELGVPFDETLFGDLDKTDLVEARVVVVAVGADPSLALEVAGGTDLPVIAVPLTESALALLNEAASQASLSMVAIGGAYNAGLLAAQYLGASGSGPLLDRVHKYKEGLRRKVLAKKLPAKLI